MQDFSEMQKKQQQDYQRSRDPFEYGRQVAQRRYSEIMSNLEAQRQGTQQSYGDLYQQTRQRAVGFQAAGGPTLSGGMGQQRRDYVSTLEMQELGRIGQAREGAMRDLSTQAQSAFANSELEGQQATQLEVQNRQTQLQLFQQRQAIIDSDLSEEQKAQQIAILEGGGDGSYQAQPLNFGQKFFKGATITAGVLGASSLALGTAGAIASASINTTLGAAKLGLWASGISGFKAVGGGILGLGKLGGFIGGALAAIPGWGWAVLATIAAVGLAVAIFS
jgi:hypothetical protein